MVAYEKYSNYHPATENVKRLQFYDSIKDTGLRKQVEASDKIEHGYLWIPVGGASLISLGMFLWDNFIK